MRTVLAFDVYGTLIDTAGLVPQLQRLVGAEADTFSRLWRDKQLEYSFRRGLMRRYESFAICTRDALEYVCRYLGTRLSTETKRELLDAYRKLPAFDDAAASLAGLRAQGFALYAFSNGAADAVETLLVTAGIRDYFLDVVSVESLQTFKPNPDVYDDFVRRSAAPSRAHAWLVSSNPFDVIGAVSAGMQGAWVRRAREAVFDPWGIDPTIVVGSLRELGERIIEHRRGD